jgi:Rrf2 family protein
MQLKNQVEWALHCCAILAGVAPGHYLGTRAMAELHGVPKEYLSKALQALSQAGVVESTLGPSGGYRLARAPEAISFWDIVEAVEGKGPAFTCTEIRRNNPCLSADICYEKPRARAGVRPCAIARVMWEAEAAWRDKLRAVTLADLAATLERDVPADIWAATGAWVAARS